MIFIKNEAHIINHKTTNEYYVIVGTIEERDNGGYEYDYDLSNPFQSYEEALKLFNSCELENENSFVEIIYSPLDSNFDNERVMFKTKF